MREINCRTGPAGNYDLVATYPVGQWLEVIAKDLEAGNRFVRNSEKPEKQCYLLAQNIRVSGDTSNYIKVTDQKVNKSVEEAFNSFHQYNSCVLAREISPLNPGAAGYVNSPRFSWEVHGHKLRAVIMLCVKQDLKGECITQTVDVKP